MEKSIETFGYAVKFDMRKNKEEKKSMGFE